MSANARNEQNGSRVSERTKAIQVYAAEGYSDCEVRLNEGWMLKNAYMGASVLEFKTKGRK